MAKCTSTPLETLIQTAGSNVNGLRQFAGDLLSGNKSISTGAASQAAALQQTSASIEEIAAMSSQNAAHLQEADNMIVGTQKDTHRGQDAVKRMLQAIDEIKASADKTAAIIRTIDEIAFQTNLLALNAAVEAARAGEAGKGFAVVAEEVRNLAQRSADAAKETSNYIQMSQGHAENGVKVSKEVDDVFQEIAGSVQKVGGFITGVANSSFEQADGIRQINSAVIDIDNVTQSNAMQAEESLQTNERLITKITDLVSMFAGVEAVQPVAKHPVARPQQRAARQSTIQGELLSRNKSPAAERKMPMVNAAPKLAQAAAPILDVGKESAPAADAFPMPGDDAASSPSSKDDDAILDQF
ncbi:MAG: hypothetical protein HRU15_08335 [Planctomycetes bacterium]|nr:hypothetical protein [Planctomycetota bacterium]